MSQVPTDKKSAIYEKFRKGDQAEVPKKFKDMKSADVLVVSSKCFGVGQYMGPATVMITIAEDGTRNV